MCVSGWGVYGMIWYDMAWHGLCGMVWHDMVLHGMVYGMIGGT